MIDVQAARHDPELFRAALARRGAAEAFDALMAADARWRELVPQVDELRSQQKLQGKPTPEQLEQLSKAAVRTARSEASRLMLGWFANAHPAAEAQYSYLGEAESVEGKAYVIEVKNADNFTARLFIDQQSNLPLMVTYQGPQPRVMTMGGPGATPMSGGGGHVVTQVSPSMTDEQRKKAQAEVDKQMQEMQRAPQPTADYVVYFEEWKTVDGIKFPFKMRRAMSGTTTEEWTVSKVKVNPKVDPKRFAGES